MASRLYHRYSTERGVQKPAVRNALSLLTNDDVSVGSPISAGASEVAIVIEDGDVVVRVEGHDGDWTRTSEETLRKVIEGVDGVNELVESKGGFETDG